MMTLRDSFNEPSSNANIILTEEAKRILQQENDKFILELKEAAFFEAINSRGEPVEVTASDIIRARQLFKRTNRIKPMSDLLIKTYAILGLMMLIVGLYYPQFKSMFDTSDPISKYSLLLTVSGMAMILLSFFAQKFLQYRPYRLYRHADLPDDEKEENK